MSKRSTNVLCPGKAYVSAADASHNFGGKWAIARSKTHFMADAQGWCAYFHTEADAKDAYAKYLQGEAFNAIPVDELLLDPLSKKDREEIARLALLAEAGFPSHQIVL